MLTAVVVSVSLACAGILHFMIRAGERSGSVALLRSALVASMLVSISFLLAIYRNWVSGSPWAYALALVAAIYFSVFLSARVHKALSSVVDKR